MQELVDLDLYPIDKPGTPQWMELIDTCRAQLEDHGLFNLAGFLRPGISEAAAQEVHDEMQNNAFTHSREHNIYFKASVDDLPPDHPALTRFRTTNHTICADQIPRTLIMHLYQWPEFAAFLAAVMGKPKLYTMSDPLARVNVMAYREGESLNWHFDRSEFTTTLLLQAPSAGGVFEYAQDLRSDDDPNFTGVADLIAGDMSTTLMPLDAGTLNVFRGKNTAHRVTPVQGNIERMIAVFSYFENQGVEFSPQERLGFYGRSM